MNLVVCHSSAKRISWYSEMLGKCIVETCPVSASFGPLDSKLRLYCKAHKLDNCINVVNPLCLFEGCKTQATYGTPDFKKKYCSVHKNAADKHISKYRAQKRSDKKSNEKKSDEKESDEKQSDEKESDEKQSDEKESDEKQSDEKQTT